MNRTDRCGVDVQAVGGRDPSGNRGHRIVRQAPSQQRQQRQVVGDGHSARISGTDDGVEGVHQAAQRQLRRRHRRAHPFTSRSS
ncbi:hypothetical protein X011_03415 [Mycobacterium tuberculosis variant microti OV254]|nr:hypothetical protein X011_03415 [Mycobacterium tuberculosis variant microti OV254]